MAKVKNILRCYAMGMGIKEISNTFNLSRNTVRRYVRQFMKSGYSLDSLMSISELQLQELFDAKDLPDRRQSLRRIELEALLPDYAKRLRRRGVTAALLHEEYIKANPNGYRLTQFKVILNRYRQQFSVVGHVEHSAGDQMYIDFAGDKLEIVDAVTGEVRKVEVFVAILPCSHYTYCEAVWSQRKEELIQACENALHFYGGVPMAIVPDNLKAAVTKSDRNEAIINEEFAAFAEFYNCAVYPARVRRPKDKALVENAVKLMYNNVYTDIEGLVFHDLDSLNVALHHSLEAFNNKKMTRRKQSRRELFDELEASSLQPLPAIRFQKKCRKTVTVMSNSYITLNKHHYSMPKEYIGKRVDVIYDADTLDIYHGLKLVTTHHRDDTPYAYTRKSSHNLPGRHGSYEKDLDEIFQRAALIDNIVLLYLREVAAHKVYPPLAFRVCRGIISLEKKYGLERLVAACACASQSRRYGYNDVKEILERGDDAEFIASEESRDNDNHSLPAQHKNIRGREYFEHPSKLTNKTNIKN